MDAAEPTAPREHRCAQPCPGTRLDDNASTARARGSKKYRGPHQPSRSRQPHGTYSGSRAPRPRPGWLCCTHTVCNENRDGISAGSSLPRETKAKSNPAPTLGLLGTASNRLQPTLPAPPCYPRRLLASPVGSAPRGLCLGPPPTSSTPSRRSAHLLQTITPMTMDTSTVSPAMATTAMMRTGFCSLEATVTAGREAEASASRPGHVPGPAPPRASLRPPARQGTIPQQCQATSPHPHEDSHPGPVLKSQAGATSQH